LIDANPMVITDRCEIADFVKDQIGGVVPLDVQSFIETDTNHIKLTVEKQFLKLFPFKWLLTY